MATIKTLPKPKPGITKGECEAYFNLIPDDEPVFILRGQDVLGPATIRHWAQGMTAFGGREYLVNQAHKCADAMASRAHRKLAD